LTTAVELIVVVLSPPPLTVIGTPPTTVVPLEVPPRRVRVTVTG